MDQLADRLGAVERACQGIAAEIIIVNSATAPASLPSPAAIPTVIVASASGLVPLLWGAGIATARGRVVALTTTQFRVHSGWARALIDALKGDALVAVGGRMALASGAGMVTRAVFLIRYSEHMGPAGTPEPRDIAGDNAAYVRAAVLRVRPDVAAGFWEVDAHRLLRAEGARFGRASDAVAEFAPGSSLYAILANRFVHGSHFGAYRVRALGWPRWKAVAVTPLVPWVLLVRIIGRARRAGQSVGATLALVPTMLLLLAAWAAGEARGALSSSSRRGG